MAKITNKINSNAMNELGKGSITTDVGNIIISTKPISPYVVILYFLSIALTFFTILFSVSESRSIGAASRWVLGILLSNFLLIIFFAFLLFQRFKLILSSGNNGAVGSKLHVRYVRLFMLAAAIPSVLIAIFSALTIGRGVHSWLSGQVKDAIGATYEFGKQSLDEIKESVKSEILAMSSDINAAAPQFISNKEEFDKYLASQTEGRGFVAAYIIDNNNNILSKAVRPIGAPTRDMPDKEDFATADVGDIDVNIDDISVNVLFRLNAFDNKYLQAVRLTKPEQVKLLKQAEKVISAYQTIETRQAQVQIVFALGFIETVLLVIIGAGWLGFISASRVSYPIAQLANAAQRVRAGDFSARVIPDMKVQELTSLSNTFNEMTEDLGSQKLALEASNEEALLKSQFIQAVLEGVSAGVISLDKNFKIETANGSASRLLGVDNDYLLKNGLDTIAPEFLELAKTVKPNYVAKAHIDKIINENNLIFDVKVSIAGDDLVLTFDEISNQIATQRQAAWRDVARRIAHEIKNPLTPIQLSAERLSRKFGKQIENDKDTFDNLTNTIVRQVTDIGRMVDEFSSFARMPTPKFNLEDVCEILRESVFSQKIANPEIEYNINTPPEAIYVEMDARLISQAILNILKNSAEAILNVNIAQNFVINYQINAFIEIEQSEVIIRINDNGLGFPKQDRAKLLEPYVTTRAKGTGLGLAIVARVLEEHNGKILLGDRIDGKEGAEVKLVLPLASLKDNIGARNAI